jgi:hypothetical protein
MHHALAGIIARLVHPLNRKIARSSARGVPELRVPHLDPRRKVPGRKGVTWEEADWVDKDATAHRGPDE